MDERENKISGSGMGGYSLCPGKFNAELPFPRESSPAAEMGIRIHEYIATGKGNLTEEEIHIADLCKRFYAEAIDQINAGDITETILEQRYWYDKEWSGQIDRIDFVGETTAIVTDYKTGRIAQGNAAENLQLRAYAVLVAKQFPKLERIFAAVVQPMTSSPLTICQYDKADLVEADEHVRNIVSAAYMPNAPRIPNPDACRYCKARSQCPEALGTTHMLAKVDKTAVTILTNEQLSEFLERAAVVEDVIDALRVEAKARLKAGQSIDGYRLDPPRTSRSIKNAEDAYGKLQNIIDPAEFAKCCKVSVPQLEKVVATATQTKPKEAKQKLAELLGETLESKQSDDVMSRVK